MHRTLTLFVLLVSMVSAAQPPVGPDAPSVSITYDGTAMHFTLSNPPGSNNESGMYYEGFVPVDPTPDPFWRFQGYVVFELSPADDDSLLTIIHDQSRAPALVYTDIIDAISLPYINLIFGTDSCYSDQWILPNDGPTMTMSSYSSFITGDPWHPDSTYCFLALAFATTPHYIDPDCGTEQTVLFSRQSPFGALQVQCVTPATVGMTEEVNAPMRIWPNPTTDVLHVRTPTADTWQATCIDAQGRTVLQQRINVVDVIAVKDLPAGIYQIVLRADDGRVMNGRFVVERNAR